MYEALPINPFEKFFNFLNSCGDDPIGYAEKNNIDIEKEYDFVLGRILKTPNYSNRLTIAQFENLGKIAKHYNSECGPAKEECGHKCGTIFCTKRILKEMERLENSNQI